MCKTEMCWATKGPRWGPKVCTNERKQQINNISIETILTARQNIQNVCKQWMECINTLTAIVWLHTLQCYSDTQPNIDLAS